MALKKAAKQEVESETALTPQTQAGLPVAFNAEEWGVQSLSARDIVIPKILAMQAMSKKVTDGEASIGEFRDSLNNVKLGDTKTPIEFIPFFMEKVWIVFEERNGAMKFTKTLPIDATNENWPYEEYINEVKVKRDRTMNFYCLLPGQVKDGSAIPYILSFRRTSAKAGQKLATTMFMKNLKAGKTPASMVMEITGTKTSNDKGTFIVMDVREKRPSTDQEVTEAFSWVKTIRAGQTKVDNSDLQSEAKSFGSATVVDSQEF